MINNISLRLLIPLLYCTLCIVSNGYGQEVMFQKKYSPLRPPYGSPVTRTYGTILQNSKGQYLMTFSNDSAITFISTRKTGTIVRGYDMNVLGQGTKSLHSWGAISLSNNKLLGTGTFHKKDSFSYPIIYELDTIANDSSGAGPIYTKMYKMNAPGSSGYNSGGGNAVTPLENGNAGLLWNYVPYKKLRQAFQNHKTYDYNLEEDICIAETNESGTLQWARIYADSTPAGLNTHRTTVGLDIVEAWDKLYVTGMANSLQNNPNGCTNRYDMLLMKTDDDGDINWMKTYHYGRDTRGYRIFPASNDHFVIIGYTTSDSCSSTADSSTIFVTEIDSAGSIQWSYQYYPGKASVSRPAGWDVKYFDAAQSDGGYVVTAGSYGRYGTDSVTSLFSINNNGDIQWAKVYDSLSKNKQFGLIAASDNGYAAAIFRNSYKTGLSMGMVKTSGYGKSSCLERDTFMVRDTLVWGAPDTIKAVALTAITQVGLNADTSNNFLDQYSCNDIYVPNVTDSFTINTNHCTCGYLELLSGTEDGATFYVDDMEIGSSDALFAPYLGRGRHTIRAVNHDGNKSYDTTFTVNLYNGVFEYSLTKGINSVDVSFSNNSGDMLISYEWDFGDGNTNTSSMALTHNYSKGGAYEICLKVRTGYQNEYCESRICRVVCFANEPGDCCNCE